MSLLDFKMPGLDTAEGQGIMAAALSLLQAQKMPGQRGLAGALGGAGQQYMQTSGQARQQAMQSKLQGAQLAQYEAVAKKQQEEADREKQVRELYARYATPGQDKQSGYDYAGLANGMAAIDPIRAFELQSKFNPAPKYETVAPGSSMYKMGPNGPELSFTAPNKEKDLPSAVQEYQFAAQQGYGGSFTDWLMSQKRAGATNVNNTVSVAGPENQYNKDIGAGLAKDSLGVIDAAKLAPETVINARMVRKALDSGAITGTGADARLALQKALETVGLVGPGKAANTQALMSGLSKITLSGIKSSGLGGGNGFTNTDREFLQSAISGNLSDTPENLRRVADLSERVAIATHKKGSTVIQRFQKDPALKNVVQDTQLDDIPAEDAKPSTAMPTLPPAQQHKGRTIRDTATGKMLKSNGMTWVEVQ